MCIRKKMSTLQGKKNILQLKIQKKGEKRLGKDRSKDQEREQWMYTETRGVGEGGRVCTNSYGIPKVFKMKRMSFSRFWQ